MTINRRIFLAGIGAVALSAPFAAIGAARAMPGSAAIDQGRMAGGPARLSSAVPDDIDPFDRNVGEKLRKAREAKNLSQTDIGRLLGKSQATVSSYETGKAKVSPEHLGLLCRFLEIDANELLGIRPRGPKEHPRS